MSGFAGFINRDGKPADAGLLRLLAESMSRRGPDGTGIWSNGSVGFAHTMLRTTWESAGETQPCSVDGGATLIVADCRIDGRQDLIRELAPRLPSAAASHLANATDPELILYAWSVWGEDCAARLLGDFSFAIWDGRNRRLFCARDQLGVKLLYYAQCGAGIVFSNTLNTLLLHPSVSEKLNEAAIGDFLLFGMNRNPATTFFEGVLRLEPAHTFVWSEGRIRLSKYWTLPVDPPLRLRKSRDYVEQFRDLFRTAVRDRLRTDSAGIMMSGGLDSTGIAATLKELARCQPSLRLDAWTQVFDSLMPDDERHYANLAASYLGIPIHLMAVDDHAFYEACPLGFHPAPDPLFIPARGPVAAGRDRGAMAKLSRVAFYGEGPDDALYYEWKTFLRYSLRHRHFLGAAQDILSFPFHFKALPFSGRAKRSRSLPADSGAECFPPWIDPGFADRMNLRERYSHFEEQPAQAVAEDSDLPRPGARGNFSGLLWQSIFEGFDPGISDVPLEIRHPYLDLRLLRFMLAIPVLPWCRNKFLLRKSFEGSLPPEILCRPKTSLTLFADFEYWKRFGLPRNLPVEALHGYVSVDLLASARVDSSAALIMQTRALTLACFLQSRAKMCTVKGSTV